jgi:hypothetical protein
LARKPANHKVNRLWILHRRNVIIDWDIRPVRRKHTPLPRIKLALPRNRHASPLKPHVGATDARERTTDAHCLPSDERVEQQNK